jgi:hypothetical protein
VAVEWGINDDYEREEKLSRAGEEELRALVRSIDDAANAELFGWLGGPESQSPHPSEEYVCFTCLTMALDSAKVKLKRLRGG